MNKEILNILTSEKSDTLNQVINDALSNGTGAMLVSFDSGIESVSAKRVSDTLLNGDLNE